SSLMNCAWAGLTARRRCPTGRRGRVECDARAAGSAKSGGSLTHGYLVVDASDTAAWPGPRQDRKSAQPGIRLQQQWIAGHGDPPVSQITRQVPREEIMVVSC